MRCLLTEAGTSVLLATDSSFAFGNSTSRSIHNEPNMRAARGRQGSSAFQATSSWVSFWANGVP